MAQIRMTHKSPTMPPRAINKYRAPAPRLAPHNGVLHLSPNPTCVQIKTTLMRFCRTHMLSENLILRSRAVGYFNDEAETLVEALRRHRDEALVS